MKSENLTSIIASKGVTHTFLAKQLNISYGAFLNKLQGKNEFKVSEIDKLSHCLNLTNDELINAFFSR